MTTLTCWMVFVWGTCLKDQLWQLSVLILHIHYWEKSSGTENSNVSTYVQAMNRLKYSIVKDSNADLTVGNWNSKIDPQPVIVLV